jgi:lipopolysaccharide transport system ATP-binding protein
MSSSDVAISARNLRKSYRIYHNALGPLLDVIDGRKRYTERVALDGIDLELRRGEIVGVLGRNGAGKSTLLKIIAGTLDPTAGELVVRGRITAILELGTGFHSEYTGRENVYLGGLCLGMSRAEIEAKLESIIAFSELREVIDQPFKTYSSGMQARLTFATAISVDPDILIVDEALSVGDARFQLKSFDRIREFKRCGKSILIVSHSINQLVSVSDRAILLERGQILMDGEPNAVGNAYHELLFGPPAAAEALALPLPDTPQAVREPEAPPVEAVARDDQTRVEASHEIAGRTGKREHRYGDGAARITDFRILNAEGRAVTRLRSLETYTVVVTIHAVRRLGEFCVGILVRNGRGQDIFATDTLRCQNLSIAPLAPGEEAIVRMRLRANIAAGYYFLTATVARPDGTKHDVRFDALMIEVAAVAGLYSDTLVNLEPEFQIERAPISPRPTALVE